MYRVCRFAGVSTTKGFCSSSTTTSTRSLALALRCYSCSSSSSISTTTMITSPQSPYYPQVVFIPQRQCQFHTLSATAASSVLSFQESIRCDTTTTTTTLPTTTFVARRHYTSKKRRPQKKKGPKIDPFQVLNVPKGESYATIKRAFLQIAMKHHPDTSNAKTEEEIEAHRDIFVQARKAFELLTAGPDGKTAILKSESEYHIQKQKEEEDLEQWFKNETGHEMPYMDAQTIKEVQKMTETVGDMGLDRDGGMWTLARMVSASAKKGGDGSEMLRLEAGEVRQKGVNGILRRRRRR